MKVLVQTNDHTFKTREIKTGCGRLKRVRRRGAPAPWEDQLMVRDQPDGNRSNSEGQLPKHTRGWVVARPPENLLEAEREARGGGRPDAFPKSEGDPADFGPNLSPTFVRPRQWHRSKPCRSASTSGRNRLVLLWWTSSVEACKFFCAPRGEWSA